MRFETRLYLYDSSQEANGYRGTDFSSAILQGDSDIDSLDETLDVVNLTLVDLPFSEEFSPLTKFIYEKWQWVSQGDDTTMRRAVNLADKAPKELILHKDWHLMVNQDIVSQPIMQDPTRFDHAITFNEASIDAQKRIVDNIAVTYKLKDVTLDTKSSYNPDKKVNPQYTAPNFTPSRNFVFRSYGTNYIGNKFVWQFPSWRDGSNWDGLDYYQLIDQEVGYKEVTFKIPTLLLQNGVYGSQNWANQGYCSVNVEITTTDINTGKVDTVKFRSDPMNSNESTWLNPNSMWTGAGRGVAFSRVSDSDYDRNMWKRVAKYEQTNNSYTIRIESNKKYNILCTLPFYTDRDVNQTSPNFNDANNPICYNSSTSDSFFVRDSLLNASVEFEGVFDDSTNSIFTKSAPPANAYDLYNKAMLTTQNYKKVDGIVANETPTAYYLDINNKEDLLSIPIIESLYNQKNFWEILLEVGKYIHAIPQVRFGTDDRFLTTFKYLGGTTRLQDNGNELSIFNSRQVDEYINATISYVSNLVQLGGIIDEWVAPKSSSNDYLVYNDVVEIIVSRPIVEIVLLEARNSSGTTQDITEFVFESNIYKLFSISASNTPNKGLAIHYSFGDNKIQGLPYRLPSINSGDTDTENAMKRILGLAFGISPTAIKDIKVNDYIFHVMYRTKDIVRSNQTRPDLRKYLLTSKYDQVPQANQFKNQTDILVDSIKYGNNTYGELIRTGNTNYTKTEWHDDLRSVKQSGQLYEIRGEWYYVSKVKNTYYANHVVSEVEFSKDFNRLNQIVGIPSEPRFYEISEQSSINRQININDFLIVTTDPSNIDNANGYVKNGQLGITFVTIFLVKDDAIFPKFAVTAFKSDEDKNVGVIGYEQFYEEFLHPINSSSTKNTLTLSWKMEDNFSAGTSVSDQQYADLTGSVDKAYATLQQNRYTDVFGRADLFEFIIIRDFVPSTIYETDTIRPLTNDEIRALPQSPLKGKWDTWDWGSYIGGTFGEQSIIASCKSNELQNHSQGIVLLKDNREVLSFNYNLQVITDSDRFVLSGWLWQQSKSNLKLALLHEEVNKISKETIESRIILSNQLYNYALTSDNGFSYVDISSALRDIDMTDVKAIAIISTDRVNDNFGNTAYYFVMALNVSDLSNDDKMSNWYIGHPNKAIFDRQ
ncbi:MAG: hypothetical protein LBK70_00325 [Clostridiales bacterium]|jgi:hypothetical protein|nr:hypothetical protein [Clostridiales bacterium]